MSSVPIFSTLPRTFSIDKNIRVAIIIPYRNRAEHLAKFFTHFDSLSRTINSMHYEIFVIEQMTQGKFNVGLLRNIGFFIANRTQTFDRFIFHDVDSYPSPTLFRQYIAFPGLNIHYASPYLGYKYKYAKFMGGVVSFNSADFIKINGYPNTFFGWGGEDDALCSRVIETNTKVYRPAVGRYELAEHPPPTIAEKNMQKHKYIAEDKINWRNNGVMQLTDPALNIKYRRLSAPTDIIPASMPETLLANFRRGKNTNNIHFYGIDWPSIQGGSKKNKNQSPPDLHGYNAAYIPHSPENEGQYINQIREFMKYQNNSILPTQNTQNKPCIALLFIVQNKMPLIDIWSAWLDAANDSSHFEVFIHAKYPIELRKNLGTHPFSRRIINSRDSPNKAMWGSIELTQTMHFLLYTSLKHTKTKALRPSHFVFLSESCIPIVHPNAALLHSIELGTRSQFKIERIHQAKDKKYSVPLQYISLGREIPEECVLKSGQWVMLSYTHAHAIITFCEDISKMVSVWYLMSNSSKLTDEMFMPTVLSLALGKDIDEEVDTQCITYTEHQIGAPHPRIFTNLSRKLIQHAQNKGSCFLRKIAAPANATAMEQLLHEWYDAVMN